MASVEDRRGLVQDRGGLVKPRGGVPARVGRAVGQGVRAANNIVSTPARLAGSAVKGYMGGLYSGMVGDGHGIPGIGDARAMGSAVPPHGGLQPPIMAPPPYGGGQPPAQGQGGLVESGLAGGAPQFNMELAPAEPRLLEGVEPGVAPGTYRYDTAGNPEQAAEYGQAIYSGSAYGATPEGFEAGLPRGGRPTGGQAGLGYYDTSQGLSQAEHDELTRIRGQKTQQEEEQARRRAAPPLVIGQDGGYGLFSKSYRDRRNARLTAENTASGIRGFDKKSGYTRLPAAAQAQMIQGAMNRYDRTGIAGAGIAERGRQADQRYGLGQAQLSEEGRQADMAQEIGLEGLDAKRGEAQTEHGLGQREADEQLRRDKELEAHKSGLAGKSGKLSWSQKELTKELAKIGRDLSEGIITADAAKASRAAMKKLFLENNRSSGAPTPGARKAPDGKWYVLKDGQYNLVEE